MYAAGSTKKSKKNTLNTRGCSFGVPLNTRGGFTRTPHGKKHTEHMRVQFWDTNADNSHRTRRAPKIPKTHERGESNAGMQQLSAYMREDKHSSRDRSQLMPGGDFSDGVREVRFSDTTGHFISAPFLNGHFIFVGYGMG